MTLAELKAEVRKYMYLEDTGVIDIALASVVATCLKLGNPVWMIIIGPSSGGKSQILRPISLANPKFMHRIDDLTENTFLSGMSSKDKNMSLLQRIGAHGILVMSDLTVLFSKHGDARAAILSQFRMIYDGEMTKFSGTKDKAITWKGSLGVLAGSTPSIYQNFEEVADMGERFIYYRMKPYDKRTQGLMAAHRPEEDRQVDDNLAQAYSQYLKEVTADAKQVTLSEEVMEKIVDVSLFAEKVRTSVRMDFKENYIEKIPVTAFPARIVRQLVALAKGLTIMKGRLSPEDIGNLEWCAYSLANEEKRACLDVLCRVDYSVGMRTQTVADRIGLPTTSTNKILQGMAATGVLKRSGDGTSLVWSIQTIGDWKLVRQILGVVDSEAPEERDVSAEETDEADAIASEAFEKFGLPVGQE